MPRTVYRFLQHPTFVPTELETIMAALSDLPSEILLLIVDNLDDHEATLDLTSTCRQLHTLLHLGVFRNLEINHKNTRLISRLTHTFAQDTKCAQTVRTLHFTDGPGRSSRHDTPYDPAIIRPLLELVPDSSGPERATHEANLKAGHNHASWLAILLPLLPNLESLGLILGYLEFYTLGLFRTITSTNPETKRYTVPILPHLKHISARHMHAKYDLRASYIIPFFRLPTVTSFTGRMIRDNRETDEIELRESWYDNLTTAAAHAHSPTHTIPYEPFSNITHLTLEHSTTARGFADLLYACKALKSFIYTHGYRGDEPGCAFAPRPFYFPLRRHSASLEELAICYAAGSFRQFTEVEEAFLGSFAEFPVLRRVRLCAQNLLAFEDGEDMGAGNTLVDVLPRSIEEVVIEDFEECYDQGFMVGQVKRLISEAGLEGRFFPRLCMLEVRGVDPGGDVKTHNFGFPRVLPIAGQEWEGSEDWGWDNEVQ
ncbi:hypothetical protein BJX64DRAFT_285922 [Aspergillus heterothallicus]